MKKIIVTAVAIFTASVVSSTTFLSPAKSNVIKIVAGINTTFSPNTNKKDISSAD